MTTPETSPDADVIVIGGGPAGSAIGSYLAMHGYSTALFEREIHPREHVGESLVPATNRVLEDIGFWPKMGDHGWTKKPGATWTGYKGRVGTEVVGLALGLVAPEALVLAGIEPAVCALFLATASPSVS